MTLLLKLTEYVCKVLYFFSRLLKNWLFEGFGGAAKLSHPLFHRENCQNKLLLSSKNRIDRRIRVAFPALGAFAGPQAG